MTAQPDRSDNSTTTHRPRWTWQWAVLLVLMVAVLEIVSRVEELIVNAVPITSRITAPRDLVWLHPQGARGRPGGRYQQLSLNGLGFRGPEMSPAKPPGTVRIVVVGASETFGLYESQGREYPRQLEDSLRARSAAACPTRAIEVGNAALPGMATPSMVHLLDQVVRKAGPDVIVLYPSPGFYLNPNPPRPSAGAAGADSALPLANALKLRVAVRARRQARSLVPEPIKVMVRRMIVNRRARAWGEKRFTAVPEDRIAQFEDDLRRAVGIAKSTGARVMMMGHTNATMEPGFSDSALVGAWVYQFPRASAEALVGFHARSVDLERQIARDSGLVYVDLPAAFTGKWEGTFADFVHFTDLGSAVVAGTLADAISPWIDCDPR
ncbi:MAG TPA: hypothetical protein VF981_12610 [Gemmatimonadaceae bacterium]